MNRPKIEDFKPKYTKGVAEIASVSKQYVRAQDEYIDYLEQQVKNCSLADVSGCLPDLESREFFELMQQYRIAPMENQERVIKAFEAVKEWLRANCH